MNLEQFMDELRSLIGGEVDSEELVLGSAPRLYAHYRGHFVKVDFVLASELLLDVNTTPPHRLRVRRRGFAHRLLGRLGLAGRKTGDAAFDARYIVDNATQEQAVAALSSEVRSLLAKLEPFDLFELTDKEYRCCKSVGSLAAYTPRDAVVDLDAMIGIAEAVGGEG